MYSIPNTMCAVFRFTSTKLKDMMISKIILSHHFLKKGGIDFTT